MPIPSRTEDILYKKLLEEMPGLVREEKKESIERQFKIGRYYVDFLIRGKRGEKDVIVEVEGPYHDYRPKQKRFEFLENQGYYVIRVCSEVIGDKGKCKEMVSLILKKAGYK